MFNRFFVNVLSVLSCVFTGTAIAESPLGSERTFAAVDTLNVGDEQSADARECLAGLAWQAGKFQVVCEDPKDVRYDVLVRFPSPIDSGSAVNDRVALEWFLARDGQGKPLKAPAVVVVHESDSSMVVGRLVASGLCVNHVHAFMIQLPYYGERREGGKDSDPADLVRTMKQAVADVRRARDAVAVLPFVDTQHIALQGTSLGGFVSSTAGGLDHGYNSVHLLLAGGNLFELIQHGEKDAAKVRERLAKAGFENEKLRELLLPIEPTRIAHRLDPRRTWLYSGKTDNVVPMENALALAKAAGLEPSHHVIMNADHYSGVVLLPQVLRDIRDHMKATAAADAEQEAATAEKK